VTGPPEWNPGETRASTPAGSFAIHHLRNATRLNSGRGLLARVARWLCVGALAVGAAYCAEADPLPLTGFNMAGAEFGALPGQAGKDYFYPSQSDVTEMLLRGANIFRLPFRWERVQPKLGAPFDAAELDRLTAAVNMITSKGAKVIISPHNYARYQNEVIGSPAVPIDDFAAFWRQLAAHFGDNSLVVFGLMNEPHDLPTLQWRDAANAAIAAIRASGAMNLILAPGNNWTGGHNWNDPAGGASNADAMAAITDPQNNFAYEIHQYLDADYSGTHGECSSPDVGEKALIGVTQWLTKIGRKGFLAEFGVSTNPVCLQAMDSMLYFAEDNPQAWVGWTYWAAGSWWGANWFSAQPREGVDPPQLSILLNHIAKH